MPPRRDGLRLGCPVRPPTSARGSRTPTDAPRLFVPRTKVTIMRPPLALPSVLWFLPAAHAQHGPVHLFVSGKEGYPRYRIPSLLVAPNGDLLAVCEGRKDGDGLKGKIDIVMKRSS